MMRHVRSLFIYALGVVVLLWIIGFCVFCYYAVSLKYASDEPVDGVVVLTGGADRIDTGIAQMRAKKSEALLISGVNKIVSREDILKRAFPWEADKITLGYWAENTSQNAIEVADWVAQHQLKSILLVTSFYHMPRSEFEILKHAPDLTIVRYPVFPREFNESVQWVRTKYAWFLFLEYNKNIAVRVMCFLRKMI